MRAADHTVRVEHYEGANSAKVAVSWTKQAPGLSSGAVMKADEFVSSVGVNPHVTFTWIDAYRDYAAVTDLLRDANIRWMREHVYYEPGRPTAVLIRVDPVANTQRGRTSPPHLLA